MRLPTLSLLLVLLLAAAGCSDLPSADESTEGMNPSVVITFEGGKTETRYSAEYLRRIALENEADKAVDTERAMENGESTEGMRQYQAYVEARKKIDIHFAHQVDVERERVERRGQMSEFDPTLAPRQQPQDDTNYEYIQTMLDRYNVAYGQLRQPVPSEFQLNDEPAADVPAADPNIPSEFIQDGTTATASPQIPAEFAGGRATPDAQSSGDSGQADVPSEFLTDGQALPATGAAANTPPSTPASGSAPSATATTPLTSGFDTSIPVEFQD